MKRKTEPTLIYALDTGNGKETLVREESYIDTLATYNAEKARGIQHTQAWKMEMAKLQEKFDESKNNFDPSKW